MDTNTLAQTFKIPVTQAENVNRLIASSKTTQSPAPTTSTTSEFNDAVIRYSKETSPEARAAREAQIRSEAANQRQASIDAINAVYAQKIREITDQGEKRQDANRAIAIANGLGGSNVGEAVKDKINTQTKEQIDAINSDKLLQIQDAITKADNAAMEKIKFDNNNRINNQQERDAAFKTIINTTNDTIKTLGAAGVTLASLKSNDPQTYNNIRNVTGQSDSELDLLFQSNNPKSKLVGTPQKIGTKLVYFTQNPDGTIKQNSYETDIGDNEELQTIDGVAYGKKIDSNGNIILRKLTDKSVKPTTTTTKPITSGKLEVTKEEIGQGASILNQAKGPDGYTDPNLYMRMYDQWVSNGGLGQDFIKNFPPNVYINPDNTDLPVYLRPKSSTTSNQRGA